MTTVANLCTGLPMRSALKKHQEQALGASSSSKKQLHFDVIRLISFPVTVGDNPSPARGPPVQIDWKPIEQVVVSLDDYEAEHERRLHFRLGASNRIELLKEVGFSKQEIEQAAKDAQNSTRLRKKTIEKLPSAHREEKLEEFKKVLACKSEEILSYPQSGPIPKDEFCDESVRVVPMFENIPCTHCAAFACTGDGADLPARVGMFRCDGKACRLLDGRTCPLTGYKTGPKNTKG
jgi:hypothetical protein